MASSGGFDIKPLKITRKKAGSGEFQWVAAGLGAIGSDREPVMWRERGGSRQMRAVRGAGDGGKGDQKPAKRSRPKGDF